MPSQKTQLERPSFIHLATRAIGYLFSRRLNPSEQWEVAQLLDSPAERSLFWDQPAADQRHALTSAQWVAGRHPDRRDLIRAALLHDVGKRHARLGFVGRIWASLVSKIGWHGTARMCLYWNHGHLGAQELSQAGEDRLVVSYARHHHGSRPDDITSEDWEILNQADQAKSPIWTARAAYPKRSKIPPGFHGGKRL